MPDTVRGAEPDRGAVHVSGPGRCAAPDRGADPGGAAATEGFGEFQWVRVVAQRWLPQWWGGLAVAAVVRPRCRTIQGRGALSVRGQASSSGSPVACARGGALAWSAVMPAAMLSSFVMILGVRVAVAGFLQEQPGRGQIVPVVNGGTVSWTVAILALILVPIALILGVRVASFLQE